jgi:mannose-6-phosphate isomerase-like protein (cupin superfamily)
LPGQSISLQKHEQREEEWHILQGRGEVHIEDDEGQDAKDRDFFYIPCGDKHRVRCTGEEPLVILEIQSGHYLEEDDIIRYEDDYGRA